MVLLGSNVASLGAQRRLGDASSAIAISSERLSSGLRINRASDDAAGLAISMGLDADKRVFVQAVRNLHDGASLLNIADAAMAELSGIVTRIKELAEQAANGTYSSCQRAALDTEAQALSKEFTRIQQSSAFNGVGLLNGGSGDVRLQAGYQAVGSILAGVGNHLGTGSYASGTTYATEDDSLSGTSCAVGTADLNKDGILDLVTTGGGENLKLTVLVGTGDGTFARKGFYTTESGMPRKRLALGIGDVNNDGNLDLVTADSADNQGQVTVFLGRGDGTFGDMTTCATGESVMGGG